MSTHLATVDKVGAVNDRIAGLLPATHSDPDCLGICRSSRAGRGPKPSGSAATYHWPRPQPICSHKFGDCGLG